MLYNISFSDNKNLNNFTKGLLNLVTCLQYIRVQFKYKVVIVTINLQVNRVASYNVLMLTQKIRSQEEVKKIIKYINSEIKVININVQKFKGYYCLKIKILENSFLK